MKLFFLFPIIFLSIAAAAQDSSRKKEVNITSTFKPTLKEAAKINFNASPPVTDTTRPKLQYTIPNQNLNFAFQPGSLKPLALQIDSNQWSNASYVKVGIGNLRTPFLQTGLSYGDGKTAGINLYAKHMSSKGKIDLQDYNTTDVNFAAFLKSAKNLEWNVRLGLLQEKFGKYGFEPKTTIFPGDSIFVRYNTWRGRIAFHNLNRTELGLSYAPEVKFDLFSDHINNSESNIYFNIPVEKRVGKLFAINLAVGGNVSRYKQDEADAIANNYFTMSPSVLFKKPNVSIQAGIRPSWDNGDFRIFPNILAEVYSTGNQFSIQVGWTGNMRNSGFQYTANFNPYSWAPVSVFNTQIEERFAGIKGAIGDHFNYSGKVSYNTLRNQPLFVNDTVLGKSFRIINEPRIQLLNIGGELGYTVGEKFSVITNLNINQFVTKENEKAWGLIPMEWKITGRLMILRDLYVNGTFYAFDGPWSLSKEGKKNLPAASELSAGLEFRVVKNISVWAQFNNIFNKEYQRWNQYPVYGFNFLGGVVFSFAQKK